MNISEFPIEILVEIIKNTNSIGIRRVCTLFYSVYENDICDIRTITEFNKCKDMDIENIPARVVDNLSRSKDSNRFTSLINKNFISKPPIYQHHWNFNNGGHVPRYFDQNSAADWQSNVWKNSYNYSPLIFKKKYQPILSKEIDYSFYRPLATKFPHVIFNGLIKGGYMATLKEIFNIIPTTDRDKYYRYCLNYCSFINNLKLYKYFINTITTEYPHCTVHLNNFVSFNNIKAVEYLIRIERPFASFHIVDIIRSSIMCHNHDILNKYFYNSLNEIKADSYSLILLSVEYENEYSFTKIFDELNLFNNMSYENLEIIEKVKCFTKKSKLMCDVFMSTYEEIYRKHKQLLLKKTLEQKCDKLKKKYDNKNNKNYLNNKVNNRMNQVYIARKVR